MIVLYLSVWLFAKREQLGNISFGLVPLAVILGIVGGLIFLQPDLSAAITIVILGGMMFFLAGGDLRQIAVRWWSAQLVIGFLVVYFNPTGSDRLTTYLAGFKDPTVGSYHVRRAFGAFCQRRLVRRGSGQGGHQANRPAGCADRQHFCSDWRGDRGIRARLSWSACTWWCYGAG